MENEKWKMKYATRKPIDDLSKNLAHMYIIYRLSWIYNTSIKVQFFFSFNFFSFFIYRAICILGKTRRSFELQKKVIAITKLVAVAMASTKLVSIDSRMFCDKYYNISRLLLNEAYRLCSIVAINDATQYQIHTCSRWAIDYGRMWLVVLMGFVRV